MAEESKEETFRALGRIALKRLRVPAPTGDPEVDRRALLVALSERFGVPALDLEQVCIRLSDLECVPRDLAEHHCLMPVLSESDRVFVAMRNPSDRNVVHEVAFVAGRKVHAYVAPDREIERLILQAYAARERGESHFFGMKCPEAAVSRAKALESQMGGATPPVPVLESSGQASSVRDVPTWRPKINDTGGGGESDGPNSEPVDSRAPLSLRPLSIPDELVPREDGALHRTVSALPPGISSLPPVLGARAAAMPFDETAADVLSALEEAFDDDQEEASAVCRLSEYPCAGVKIALVVDTEEHVASDLRTALEEQEFAVRFAADGRDALQMIKENPPALLLLGAMLPVIHGFEVARRLRETQRYSGIPIIMLMGAYAEQLRTEELRMGCGVSHFLEKPYGKQEALLAIGAAMDVQRVEPVCNLSQRVEQALEEGLLAYRNGQVDRAIEFLENGASLDPLAYRLHFHLGLLYARKGRIFDGIRALERAVEINPQHFAGVKNLAIVYFQAGFRNRAVELWERGLPLAPDADTRKAIEDHLAGLPSQQVLA